MIGLSWHYFVLNLQYHLWFYLLALRGEIPGWCFKGPVAIGLSDGVGEFFKFRAKDMLRYQNSNLKNCVSWERSNGMEDTSESISDT